ncbi:phage tail protein [Marinomonas sp.]|uniref:phage tail-collar fiber domain-containing protein n=1 Tax=Marinomonas sp. TaxID=1904862 RepID=UPI003BA92A5D
MSDFRTYITQTGFGLERDAKFNNTQVDLAVLVVGDGVLPDSASPAERTDLIHQVREYAITIEKDENDPNVWIARGEIPASDGGFFIKEAGVKTTDGYLYAYARQAGDYKPLLEEGQGKSYTIRLKFIPGNADAIQIKIDPSVQFATPTDLDNAVKAHVEEEDPHNVVSDLWTKLSAKICPIGVPLPWPTDLAPDGWAVMKGQSFDTILYPKLALAYPDGIIPDMRGLAIVGAKDGESALAYEADAVKNHGHAGSSVSSVDLGSKTTSSAGNHRHQHNMPASWSITGAGNVTFTSGQYAGPSGFSNYTSYGGTHSHSVSIGSHSHSVSIASFGATENTIKNRKFNYIVRLA